MYRRLLCGLFPILWGFFALCFMSCASTPNSGTVSTVENFNTSSDSSAEAVPLYVPERENRAFFFFDDPSIMQEMEIGSPEAIRNAISKIRKSVTNYTETEKILISIASSLMKIVWASEINNIEVPFDSVVPNPYTAAIDSAKIGIYDENTGNSDFYTLVLPSLVLLTSNTKKDYFELAHEALNRALELNDKSVLVHYLLGNLYLKENNLEKALNEFNIAFNLAPNCYEVAFLRAKTCFSLGYVSLALEITNDLLQKYPKRLDLLKLCTEITFSQKDYVSSEQFIAQVLQQEPGNLQYLLFRIRILVEQENYIKAVSLLDVYSKTDKSSKEYLLLRTRIQQEWNKNTTAAISTIEEALLLYPEDFDVLLEAANLASKSGSNVRGKNAGQLANEVLAIDSNNKRAIEICAINSIRIKDWQSAYNYNKKLINEKDVTLETLLNHVEICLNLKKLDEAENLINNIYEKEKHDDILEMYIRVQAALGNRKDVLELIESLLPQASSKLRSFLYYQRSLLATNDTDKLADLRQSLTSNPRNADPLFELYKYYFEKKDYRKAQYYLKQVVALNPNDIEILNLNSELEKLLK